MGTIARVVGQRIYLDANIFIYALEEIEPWAEITRQLLSAIDGGECYAITSELTVAECLVKPLELGRADIVQTYLNFLQNRRSLSVVPVMREILIEAAKLRASGRIKLPDAIHIATALQQGSNLFLTNDQRFQTVAGVQMLLLKDLE